MITQEEIQRRRKFDRWTLVALALSLVLGLVIQLFPLEYSEDYENYINFVLNSADLIEEYQQSATEFISNEPVWLLWNSMLYRLVDDVDLAVRMTIFFVSVALSFAVLTIDKRYMLVLLVFVLMPQMFHNFTTHVRQGAAMALYYLSYLYLGKRYGAPLMLVAPLIHSSMFFIAPLAYARDAVVSLRLNTIKSVLFFFVSFIVLGATAGVVAQFLGARQARSYEFASFAGSGLGLLFWVGVLSLVYWEGKRFYWRHIVSVAFLIQYCCIYLFLEVSGRIFDAGLLFLFGMLIHFRGWRRAAFWVAFAFYFVFSWYIKINSDVFFHGLFTGDYWL